ncbi:class I SAM-dependent RNA methyltransferase [Methyloceanibacter caenitepidi]|uniref:RNA methyltransferase n=1 Tax=Methyloceanibacter caenitepidi TaxID=1384459 RepID=A0A0A8K0P1_9HYPH|nr:class I SAM-dependent RNA methyltransferase [Methyloceanibacter caenitepidi]BAQ16543.1 RNA methyltransferase [Methyloceanibacter caenitepidi]
MTVELTVDRLGAQGDGIAETADGPVFVPFTLPGERIRAEMAPDGKHADCVEVLEASPNRVEPVCPHFGQCGGCTLQHLDTPSYLAWKRDLVVTALRSRGLDVPVEPARAVPLGSRRRATFSLERRDKDVVLGYRRARSHDTIGIDTCPILSPRIVSALPALKAMLTPLLGGAPEARVAVTETETGLDVAIEGVRPLETALGKLAGAAEAHGIARLTAGSEIVMLAPPMLQLGRAQVRLPADSFLQASPAAEAEMVALVREGVGKGKRVADLFCGLGTFSFALAERAQVDGYESNAEALAALSDAARHTPKLKPMRGYRRDLFRDPLGWQELKPYDAVVFDPPRAGAAAQAEQLAKSKVKRVVAVSCNPGTLARDLRLLVDGGYRITRVVPIDQFLYSSHVEVVAHLER